MAYFNNASFYSTPSASEELDAYQLLSQTSATQRVNDQAHVTLADRWGMVGQHGPTVGSSTGLPAAASYESVTTDGYSQPSCSERYWPAVVQQNPSYRSDFLSRDVPFAGTVASEVSTVFPTPSSVPLDYWGANQSGPSTGTIYTDVHTSYQPSTGPTRVGPMQTGRFQPYGTSRARTIEYGNAGAGPSTLVPPLVPYIGPPMPQPSGGISETPANAEQTQTNTEEDKVPTTKRARRPRGQGKPRGHRRRSQGDAHKLCEWVQGRMKLQEAPSTNEALAVAAKIIPMIRPLANSEPCLLTGKGKRTAAGSKNADDEFERRSVERGWFKELSQYYPLGQGQSVWERPKLLLCVLKDLEDLPALPGPSNEPPP